MKKRSIVIADLPDIEQLELELERETQKTGIKKLIASAAASLIIVTALVLTLTLLLPVMRIHGTSMAPSLNSGDVVITARSSNYKHGDIVAFYYGDKILVKRVIALSYDWVDIKDDGQIYVNGQPLDEPYIDNPAPGTCTTAMPYRVPEGCLFVIGDNRTSSTDSRMAAMGAISEEMIISKVLFRVWPLNDIGILPQDENNA